VTPWREPAPHEREAGDRSWPVVRAAFEERVPVPRRRDRRPLVAAAIGVAVLAAAFSPPGLAVFGSLRDAVRNEDHLVSLPTAGRILVNAHDGAWVVQRDGSKRFLAGYSDASWSPHGLYLAAARGNELVAMEPNGKIHWKLARAHRIEGPRWSYEGFRIAYYSGRSLRIVNGDGTGDHLLARNVDPGPLAWEPGTHVLAYLNRAGDIQVVNVDRQHRTATIRTPAVPRQLAWAPDGKRLLAVEEHAVDVFWQRGPLIRDLERGPARVVAASISPDGRSIAFVETRAGRSSLQVTGILGGPTGPIFSGAGTFADVFWSPDGRWLLLDWKSADQWLFIRQPLKKLVTVSNIQGNFGAAAGPAGWCCP
jgi:dipeptidyl aminopeptidase/acylaminoacyl peptidase